MLVAVGAPAAAQLPGATVEVPDSQFAARFRQADANGDGVITEAEARAAGLWFTDDLDKVDTDRSGTVTLFEMTQALQQGLKRWMAERDAADTNRDGELSEEEAARAPSIATVFSSVDLNKDRSVSRPEYESYAIERMYRNPDLPSVAPNIIEKRF